MSSAVDFAVFSMNRVSFGAILSNTTLRMLDLPPLIKRKERQLVSEQVSRQVQGANVLMHIDGH